MDEAPRETVRDSARAYARGAGGALIVGIPMLMTMEMWRTGFSIPPRRLLAFYVINFGVLLVLERFSGFRDEEESLFEEAIDAVEALGIGTLVAALFLAVFAVLHEGLSATAAAGIVALEAIPLSIGASVAISVLGGEGDAGSEPVAKRERREAGFWGTQAIGIAGAFYFGFNVAPTDEPVLIGLRMTALHSAVLVVLSLIVVHAMLYASNFRGAKGLPEGRGWWRSLFGMGSLSYVTSALIALFLLWVFGRVSADVGLLASLQMTAALAFVTSVGAAAGRLIL